MMHFYIATVWIESPAGVPEYTQRRQVIRRMAFNEEDFAVAVCSAVRTKWGMDWRCTVGPVAMSKDQG